MYECMHVQGEKCPSISRTLFCHFSLRLTHALGVGGDETKRIEMERFDMPLWQDPYIYNGEEDRCWYDLSNVKGVRLKKLARTLLI